MPCKTDGSHTNRPFFRALCRTSGKPPFLRKTSSPAMSFVSFLQEKKSYPLLFFLEEKTVSLRGKRSPLRRTSSFLFRRKEAKENQLRSSFPSVLLPFSPTCCTKRTVHIRTVRFLVPYRTCGKTSFRRLINYPAMSFVSFLQEKKSFPFFSF